MPDWKAYNRWTRVRSFAERKMRKAYMKGGNCDSCCPNCRQWESLGNEIHNKPLAKDLGIDVRLCGTCDYRWLAHFTPAGFVPLSLKDPPK